jgi:hypothetical protein
VFVNGPVKRLKGHLWHYTYDDLHDHLETMNRFSSITAQEKLRAESHFSWTDFLFRPPLRFLKAFYVAAGLHGRLARLPHRGCQFLRRGDEICEVVGIGIPRPPARVNGSGPS